MLNIYCSPLHPTLTKYTLIPSTLIFHFNYIFAIASTTPCRIAQFNQLLDEILLISYANMSVVMALDLFFAEV